MDDNRYARALDLLMNRLPMFSRIGMGAFKKDLTNILVLCEALGNPQESFRSVHVGGTNGKGSVSHMLAAVFRQAGYRTGLYTSPHLVDFRERIRVDGEMISEAAVADFVEAHEALIEQVQPSFFEITVAIAFDWFRKCRIDVAIVEVGLGGRLDSTNIILPEVSVITNVSYDHQQILGYTLEEIATEKAGIIKAGVPAVIGETHEVTRPVFLHAAAAKEAPILFADEAWKIVRAAHQGDRLILEAVSVSGGETRTAALDLVGDYQQKNFLTLAAVVDILRNCGWRLDDGIWEALSRIRELTGLRGRWEWIGDHPAIIADVAHNEAGVRDVVAQARAFPHRKLHVVTGFARDKAIDRVLDLFPSEAVYYYTQASIPRALPAEQLRQMAAERGLAGKAYPEVAAAFRAAKAAADPADLVLVTGSVFVVAEALQA